jgi:hypothetical protein
MGSRQIVLVSTAGFSVLKAGIFWQEAKTKRPFPQCACSKFQAISFYLEKKLLENLLWIFFIFHKLRVKNLGFIF